MKNLSYIIIALSIFTVSCNCKSNSEKEAGTASADKECCEEKKSKEKIAFNNADFYDENGKFNVAKAKEAVVSFMKHHGYPVFKELEENLWVSDYGTGQFTKLGLSAYMFKNNEEDKYMLMDLFLLPGQMLPEHWHLDGETNPAKREGWLVRYGKSYIVGKGEDNLSEFPEIKIPECHMEGDATTKHVVPATVGMFTPLAEVYTRHWQFGGPEGAIITEVANVHTDASVRHSDKAINDNFLGN